MATYKFDSASSPDSGDVLTWNNTANRMEWQSAVLVTVPFMFNDSDQETITYTPPKGSYVAGDHHSAVTMTVSGGGLSGTLSLNQGVVVGPTDGTQISMVGEAHIITLTDSDSTHSKSTSPVNDSDTDTDTVRLRVLDKVVVPSIALVTRPV